jgi:hypothetical protein
MYEPFRAALQAIRQELVRAGDRHPDLFYEELTLPMPTERPAFQVLVFGEPSLPQDGIAGRWQSFIKENSSEGGAWQEWYERGEGCGRLYGDAAGAKEFKPLAESLYLVLHEMDESLGDEDGGFYECMQITFGAAFQYPTPLLRIKYRHWGCEDKPPVHHQTGVREVGDGPRFAVTGIMPPQQNSGDEADSIVCIGFAHNLFTSTVAFIDTILDPDTALLVGHGLADSPTIALPKEDVSKVVQVSPVTPNEDVSEVAEASTVTQEAEPPKALSDHVFQYHEEKKKPWHLRFPGDGEQWLGVSRGLHLYHKLLLEPGRSQTIADLARFVDEDAGSGPGLTQKQIRRHKERVRKLREQADTAEKKGDLAQAAELRKEADDLEQWLKDKEVGAFYETNHPKPREVKGSPKDLARARIRLAMKRAREELRDAGMRNLLEHLEENCPPPRYGEVAWCYRPAKNPDWDL